MSDYDDDFEEGNDTFNDRTKGKSKKSPAKNATKGKSNYNSTLKDSSYDNTLARDNTLGFKPKENALRKPNPLQNAKPTLGGNSLAQPKGLAKGGVHSSTPNLQGARDASKKSLLGGVPQTTTHRKLTNFGLTKKAEQTIIPSKAMTLEQAEKLMEDAKLKIDAFKSEKAKADSGNMDERLEVSIKENKYLQKTLIGMQDIINKLFEKYDPVKAPMKSYPQTDRIKSPPKSAQMRYRTKEVENAQHALDNMMIEYEKVILNK